MIRKSKRHLDVRLPHPAEGLAGDIEALGVSKTAFAKALGVSRNTLYLLLDKKIGVTAEMAVRLETVLGPSAESWLNQQLSFDLQKARELVDRAKLTKLWPQSIKPVRVAAE